MADKMWAGRFTKELDSAVNDFNSSISFDCRMYREDITGSIAHAKMLGKQNIIEPDEAEKIVVGLEGILRDIDSGELSFDWEAEDIHMFVESVLTERIGDVGKKLHTSRSRNDQVATDTRLYMRDRCERIEALLVELIEAVTLVAQEHK